MTKFCDICKVSFSKDHALKGHLSGKSHVMKMLTEQIEENVELNKLLTALENSESFDIQLKTFLKTVAPFVENNANYKRICLRLKKALRQSFPMCTLQQIGSTLTGLGLKDDHLKMYINIGEANEMENNEVAESVNFKKFFTTAKNLVYRNTQSYSDVKLFSKVPKIKFVDKKTDISCEMHFSNGFSVHNSYLIKHYLSMNPRLKHLMIIIKYWSRICTLSTEYIYMVKSSGLYITTYALVMLFIFYLQQPSVILLPSFMKLQENEPNIINGWQVNFDETIINPQMKKELSIPQLLSGFFQFYANFDFENFVICPIDGCAHRKEIFQNVDKLPDSMDRYKEYIENTKNALTFDTESSICIQDPIELNRNCSDNLSNRFVRSFREHVSIAAQICDKSLEKDSSQLLFNLLKKKPRENNIPDDLSVTFEKFSLETKKKTAKAKVRKIKYKRLRRNFELNGNFEYQLSLFLSEVTLIDKVIKNCYEPVCDKLNQLFRQSFPMCRIHQLGSIVTGLCFQKSDLDLYLNIVETSSSYEKNTLPSVLTFRKISAIALMQLLESSNSFRKITSTQKGKMTIIKFADKKEKITCNLSFKNSLTVHNTMLIRHYLSYDKCFKTFIMIIKFWARLCGFKTGRITNYSLIWLCVFYLQQPNVNLVPSVIELKNNCDPEIIDGWQVNFESIPYPSFQPKSIPELLHGFFEFYAIFDFEQFVICPVDGNAHPKTMFKNLDRLPKSMDRYVEYVKNTENAIPLKVETTFCLQDPTELNVNCTFSTPDYFLNVFRKHVSNAAKVCRTALDNDCSDLLLNLFETVISITKKEAKKIGKGWQSESSDDSSS